MINERESKNISLHNLFKYTESQDYNITEQKYYIVVYHDYPEVLFKDIYFRTDLSSDSINSFKLGHNYRYKDVFLEKNKDFYFNAVLSNNKMENIINLYILNNIPENNNQLLFDIKCVKAFEPYFDYIRHYFTEKEENNCYIINNKNYNTNLYHIIYNDTKNEVNEKLLLKIIPKIDLNITLIIDYSKPILNSFYLYEFKKINDSFAPQIYQLDTFDILTLSKKIIYNKHYNGLKLYARNKNEFEEIEMGSLIAINYIEFKERYYNYSNFLLIIGQNNYPNYKESKSIFEIIDRNELLYYKIAEFKEYYRIQMKHDKDFKFKYIIVDYDKQYLKEDIHFSNYTLLGFAYNISYQSEPKDSIFSEPDKELNNYQIIKNNIQHLIIIRFNSSLNFKGYIDLFTEMDYSSQTIHLGKSSIRNYIIAKGKNYTFNYNKSDTIKIELLNHSIESIIYFENKKYNLNYNKTNIVFKKENRNNNLLTIEASNSLSTPIRIISTFDLNNIDKTNLSNLYKTEGKYIYDYNPNNIKKVIFFINRKYSKLRLLKEEYSNTSKIDICYNVGNMVILDENGDNCITLESNSDIEYSSEFSSEIYLTIYSKSGVDSFTIYKIQESEIEKPKPKDGGNKSNNTWIIVVCVIVGILLIAVGIFVFIRKRHKRISSFSIENTIIGNLFN